MDIFGHVRVMPGIADLLIVAILGCAQIERNQRLFRRQICMCCLLCLFLVISLLSSNLKLFFFIPGLVMNLGLLNMKVHLFSFPPFI